MPQIIIIEKQNQELLIENYLESKKSTFQKTLVYIFCSKFVNVFLN